MTDRVVVGIDPGGKSTGIVVRRGAEYLGHAVVTNDEAAIALPPLRYLDAISAALVDLGRPVPPDAWLMEAVTPPRGFKNGRRDAIQPGSLIGVAAVAGYILALLPVHLVPPAGNGSRPLRLYPPQLVGPREKTGGGILRHARSAWDVAGHTRTLTTKENTRGTH